MRITDLRVIVHERATPRGVFPRPTMPIGVVTISTDEGIDGHVFLSPPGVDVAPQLVNVAKPMLVGRDPLDLGAIWHDFAARARMFDPTVQGYVDIALWDIAGKAAGLPVHRLLGTCRTSVPAYASSWVHRHDATYVEEALAYREQGFVGYKLHPPTQRRHVPVGGALEAVPVRDDIETCAAVRRAVGDDYPLMLDSAWAYAYKEALARSRRCRARRAGPRTSGTRAPRLAEPIAVDGDGLVHAPDAPGLGIDVDWELIHSNVLAELA